MDVNETIRKKSLAEEIAELIKRQIDEGKLKENEKLPVESELAKLFGVGRSSIREAVRILSSMGLLNVQQGRGTFVAKKVETPDETFRQRVERADIKELQEIRDILEAPIARIAARRRTDDDLIKIEQHLRARKEAALSGDVALCIEADINFHKAIANATHNKIMASLYHDMTAHLTSGYEYIYKDTSRLMETQPVHQQLLQHIESGDEEAAARDAKSLWKDIKIDGK